MNDYFGLVIGYNLVIAILVGGTAGAVLNPAVALGVDFAHAVRDDPQQQNEDYWFGAAFIYMALELVGALFAVALFMVMRDDELVGP